MLIPCITPDHVRKQNDLLVELTLMFQAAPDNITRLARDIAFAIQESAGDHYGIVLSANMASPIIIHPRGKKRGNEGRHQTVASVEAQLANASTAQDEHAKSPSQTGSDMTESPAYLPGRMGREGRGHKIARLARMGPGPGAIRPSVINP